MLLRKLLHDACVSVNEGPERSADLHKVPFSHNPETFSRVVTRIVKCQKIVNSEVSFDAFDSLSV